MDIGEYNRKIDRIAESAIILAIQSDMSYGDVEFHIGESVRKKMKRLGEGRDK